MPLNEHELKLDTGRYVILFVLKWDAACQQQEIWLSELESEMHFNGITIDTEQMPMVTRSFRAEAVPLVVFIQEGIELQRIEGFHSKDALRSWLLSSEVF